MTPDWETGRAGWYTPCSKRLLRTLAGVWQRMTGQLRQNLGAKHVATAVRWSGFDGNRRRVLQTAAAAAAASALPLGSVACAGLVREDFGRVNTSASDSQRAMVESILHHASLAPSSHNTQPWRVVIRHPNRLTLFADLKRKLHVVDAHCRELLLSLGAFLENLEVAASAQGLVCQIDLVATSDLERPLAEVSWIRGRTKSGSLKHLRQRCTMRQGLQPSPLRAAAVRQIIGSDAGSIRFFPASSPLAPSIADAAVAAFRQQTYHDPAQQELAEWIRFSNDAGRAHRDGLTTASMGLTGFKGWWVRTFYDSDDVTGTEFRESGLTMVSKQVRELGGWFVVSSVDDKPSSLLQAGRAYERMALRSHLLNVGLHPMLQALEEEPFRSQLLTRLHGEGVPQFIVRAGLVSGFPEPVSLRRPVRAFTSWV